MNDTIIFPVILQLAGILVIIAEIFLPSGGILSILAASTIGYSLYIVFVNFSSTVCFAFVFADLIIIPVLVVVGLKLIAKSPVTLKEELSSKDGVTSQTSVLETFLNKQGVSLSDLRPAGVVLIDEQRVDVVTRGEYIEKDCKILVTSVTGNQVIVRKI